jgi:hypothetical protein
VTFVLRGVELLNMSFDWQDEEEIFNVVVTLEKKETDCTFEITEEWICLLFLM